VLRLLKVRARSVRERVSVLCGGDGCRDRVCSFEEADLEKMSNKLAMFKLSEEKKAKLKAKTTQGLQRAKKLGQQAANQKQHVMEKMGFVFFPFVFFVFALRLRVSAHERPVMRNIRRMRNSYRSTRC
jgi:hypothetical protein